MTKNNSNITALFYGPNFTRGGVRQVAVRADGAVFRRWKPATGHWLNWTWNGEVMPPEAVLALLREPGRDAFGMRRSPEVLTMAPLPKKPVEQLKIYRLVQQVQDAAEKPKKKKEGPPLPFYEPPAEVHLVYGPIQQLERFFTLDVEPHRCRYRGCYADGSQPGTATHVTPFLSLRQAETWARQEGERFGLAAHAIA